ncbi:serine hydrolase domain-containing protein [Leptospira limi]|uniref:Beta-lactamase family protein n=1 Tax=Leptospira limi TaxID=2950023 RepID=A0ABT3M0C0_9LEPT|nr:serine hydrolase domain-containing protein [Leptospira limi]MCW7463426.1 beta-lactamase family protein [Leptospira limi]
MKIIPYILIIQLFMSQTCVTIRKSEQQDVKKRMFEFAQKSIESNNTPGLQYVLVTAEGTVHSFSLGFADVKLKQLMTTNTSQMIYSMTKTFTAAAILKLNAEGKLDIERPLSDYLPDNPYGSKVLIKQLLSQSSGLPNPIPLSWVHLASEHPQYNENQELSEILAKHPELSFEPGTKYGYSNLSYWLLGKLISVTSGSTYEEYMKKEILSPLGLRATEVGFKIPNDKFHAKGYIKKWSIIDLLSEYFLDKKFIGSYEGDWLNIQNHYLNGPAYGGMIASADAVSIFLIDQLKENSKILNPKAKSLFYEQQKTKDGYLIPMTLGWHIEEIRSNKISFFYKEGGGAGYHSEMRIYPNQKFASVVIANCIGFDVKEFLNHLDNEYIESLKR